MDKHFRRTQPVRYHENFPGLNLDGLTLREIRGKVRGVDAETPPTNLQSIPNGDVGHDDGAVDGAVDDAGEAK